MLGACFAMWSMNKDVAKVEGLCSQFAASGKTSEDACLELLPGSRRRHSGIFSLLTLHVQIFVNKICVVCSLANAHFVDVCFLCPITLGEIRQDK